MTRYSHTLSHSCFFYNFGQILNLNRIVRAPGVQRVGRCCAVCCACLSRGGPPRARKMPHSFSSSKDVVYCGGVDAGLCFAQPNACLSSRCRDGRLLTLGFHCRYLRRLSVHVLLPVPSLHCSPASLHWIWLTSVVQFKSMHSHAPSVSSTILSTYSVLSD